MRDIDIRRTLHQDILLSHHDDPLTVVVDELGILQGTARVDVAVVNGQLHGYEIKSERDSLTRLPRQVHLYSQVFDHITLVVSECHLEQALDMTPEWWEVLVAISGKDKDIVFEKYRTGTINFDVDARSIAELLWKEEALAMLAARNADKGFHGQPRWKIWDRLCEVYTLDEIRDAVRWRLKEWWVVPILRQVSKLPGVAAPCCMSSINLQPAQCVEP